MAESDNDPNPRRSSADVDKIEGQSGGTVNIAGGDIYTLDVERLLGALTQALPANDPAPQHLKAALTRFQTLHQRLYEWKEAHHLVNDIAMLQAQFAREVERLDATAATPDHRLLQRLWRPVNARVNSLLTWAGGVKTIHAQGLPDWATAIDAARTPLDQLLQSPQNDTLRLYDLTSDFSHTVDEQLYRVDQGLRNTAGELYAVSQIVLGSLS